MSKIRVRKGILVVLALSVLGTGAVFYHNQRQAKATAVAAQRSVPGAEPAQGIDYRPTHVVAALKQGLVEVEMRGDGHTILQVTAANLTKEPLELVFQGGMVLISDNQMAEALIPRAQSIFLKPAEALRANLDVAPGSCRNEHRVRPFLVSLHRYEVLEPYWDYLAQHPEVGPEAVRTGALIIKENLPLSAFAKFSLSSGPKPDTVREAGLEVETRHIMEALFVLKKAGYPAERLAILVDPQLQLEALLDPLTRPAAKRYFAMTDSDEWTFWEAHLKTGSPSTRHYALYAIARFYPDVAIQMLPRWARFQEMSLPMRRAAILALAEVPRPEAEGLLAQLEYELGNSPALGSTVTQAMNYWAKHVKLSEGIEGLAFQTGRSHGDDAPASVEMVASSSDDAVAVRESERQDQEAAAAAAVAEASELVAEAHLDHLALWDNFTGLLYGDQLDALCRAGMNGALGPVPVLSLSGLSPVGGNALLSAVTTPPPSPEDAPGIEVAPALVAQPLVRAFAEAPMTIPHHFIAPSGPGMALQWMVLSRREVQNAVISASVPPQKPAETAEPKDMQAAGEGEEPALGVASRAGNGG